MSIIVLGNRSLRDKQQTQFNKVDRTSMSPIHKANISKESSFGSNILINAKHRVIDLNRYNSKDSQDNKENIRRHNRRFDRISEESKNNAVSRSTKNLTEAGNYFS